MAASECAKRTHANQPACTEVMWRSYDCLMAVSWMSHNCLVTVLVESALLDLTPTIEICCGRNGTLMWANQCRNSWTCQHRNLADGRFPLWVLDTEFSRSGTELIVIGLVLNDITKWFTLYQGTVHSFSQTIVLFFFMNGNAPEWMSDSFHELTGFVAESSVHVGTEHVSALRRRIPL